MKLNNFKNEIRETKLINSYYYQPSINQWKMLFWLLLAQVVMAFVGRSLAPLSAFIGENLMLTNAQIGMLPAALFFGQFVASIPAGIFVDRWGTRPFLLVLSIGVGISFLFTTITTNFGLLLLFVTLGGLGYGSMHPITNRGIIYWFQEKSRGTAMGIKQMGVTAGSAFSALLLVPIAEIYGWRAAILIAASTLIIIGFISFFGYRDTMEASSRNLPVQRGKTLKSLRMMLKNKSLLIVSGGAIGLNAAQMCVNTYIIIYTTQVLEMPIYLAAMLLVISEIGGSIGRIGWGILSDVVFKGERMIIISLVSVLSAISGIVLAILPPETTFIQVGILIFILGLCVAGFNGLWMNAATELVPPEQAGLASGFSISLGSWGVILGPPLFGLVIDITGSFEIGWYSLSGILFIISILFLQQHIELKRNIKNNIQKN